MSLVKERAYSPRRAGDKSMAKIYLVDDDENILTSVSMFLESEGYEVRKFHDGVSALEALKTSPPDLAVFDVKMPRMDGLELLRRLRQTSNLPVIFLTSKDDEIDQLLGLRHGADDYITKPFNIKEVLLRVENQLKRYRLQLELQAKNCHLQQENSALLETENELLLLIERMIN